MKKCSFPESKSSERIRIASESLKKMSRAEKLALMAEANLITQEKAIKVIERLGEPVPHVLLASAEFVETRKPILRWFDLYDRGVITRLELIGNLTDYALSFNPKESINAS